jgi:CheY-like chemotaxis protein/cytoskeletal protein RodZ
MEQAVKTAPGTARERFVESLSRRAEELRAAIAGLAAAPEAPAAREELKRRLNALLASARLSEEAVLAENVQRIIARFAADPHSQQPATPADFRALDALVAQLAGGLAAAAPAATHSGVHKVIEIAISHIDADVNTAAPTPHGSAQELLGPRPSQPTVSVSQPASEPQVLLSPRASDPHVLLSQTVGDPQVLLSQTVGDPQVLLSQTVPGLLSSPRLTQMLLVCSRPHAARFRELLEGVPLEITHAADAEEAIRLLHGAAPACALLSAEFASLPDIDLVRRLQTDPLSRLGGVYVVLPEGASYDAGFLQQTGADGVLVEPLSAEQIADLVEQSTRRGRGGLRALRALAGGTVDEIASHVAEEIRRGIADSLRAGQHERINLGDSQELMAAAWSAVGRVRSHLAEQSRGRVSFHEDVAQELPSFLAPEQRRAGEPGAASVLAGKRVLVADDDPAVLWFFSGLLRESSALVLQAQNGREALELARRKQPHLVLSDILMPKVDGFALCREIKRDALLSHVPVILLSWKDDLLERMRELDAGASGYLRKEAGSREVLAAITEVLRPRHELAQALRTQTEVLGRVEAFGIMALLETVASERPDARLTLQDAWNLFEVELRSGERLSVTRTAADGSFARGDRALLQLIGVSAGRFSVNTSTTTLRSPLAEPLGSALQSAGKALCAVLDAVSDTRLVHVALVALEDDVVDLLQSTPTRLHEVVARFRSGGTTAKDLLFDGSFTPSELEGHLRELARHGAINGVWNAEGDDLVAEARRAREAQPGALLHSSNPPSGQTARFSSLRPTAAPHASRTAGSDSAEVLQPMAADHAGHEAPDAGPWGASEHTEPDDTSTARAAAAFEPERSAVQPRQVRPNEAFEGTRLVLTLAALVAIGYLGWQRLEPHTRLGAPRSTPRVASALVQTQPTPAAAPVASALVQTQPTPAPAPVVTPASEPMSEPQTPAALETAVQSGIDPNVSIGRMLSYVDRSRGVAVGPEQGLVVVEYTGTEPPPRIRISGRELGRPPIAVALDSGRHELVVHQHGESSFRHVIVRAGETRVITLPL